MNPPVGTRKVLEWVITAVEAETLHFIETDQAVLAARESRIPAPNLPMSLGHDCVRSVVVRQA